MLLFKGRGGYNHVQAVPTASHAALHPIGQRHRLTLVWLRLAFGYYSVGTGKLHLMTLLSRASSLRNAALIPVAAFLFAAHTMVAQAPLAAAAKPSASATVPDRAASYYHYGLARLYEDMAVNAGRSDYATQAVEQYKLALDADPGSKLLQDGLADLYFKIGRIREAVTAAQDQITKNGKDIEAPELLGKVHIRSRGDMQSPQSVQMLQLAIGEYENLAQLKPQDVETHLLLGQLYALNHDSNK